jgi:hypothetical protein
MELVSFEVLRMMNTKFTLFLDVTSCNFVHSNQWFRRNVGTFLQNLQDVTYQKNVIFTQFSLCLSMQLTYDVDELDCSTEK